MRQCASAVVGAQRFNHPTATGPPLVHGCIATDSNWRILRLRDHQLSINVSEYSIAQAARILGILLQVVGRLPGGTVAA